MAAGWCLSKQVANFINQRLGQSSMLPTTKQETVLASFYSRRANTGKDGKTKN